MSTRIEVHRGEDQVAVDTDLPPAEAEQLVVRLWQLVGGSQRSGPGPAGFAHLERADGDRYEALPVGDLRA